MLMIFAAFFDIFCFLFAAADLFLSPFSDYFLLLFSLLPLFAAAAFISSDTPQKVMAMVWQSA